MLPDGTSTPGTTPISDIASLNIDAQGRVSGFTATDKIYASLASFSATDANQTYAFPHVVDQALFFINGLLLDPSEYSEDSAGFTVTNSYNGATITAIRFTESNAAGTTSYAPFTRTNILSVASESVYSATYSQGAELLFINGIFINDPDYSYPQPNQFQLNTPSVFSGNNITIISFRIFNNNAIPFSQGIGQTISSTSLVTLSGSINANYTIAAKNGIFMTLTSDYSIGAGAITLTSNPIFSGEVVENTSFAASGIAT